MKDIKDKIDARFVSGNSTPVERASITAEEWALIRAMLMERYKADDWLDAEFFLWEAEDDPTLKDIPLMLATATGQPPHARVYLCRKPPE